MNIGNCKHRVHHSHFWSLVPKLAPRLPKSCTSYWLLRSNKLLLLHPLPLRQIRTADHTPLDSDCGGRSNFLMRCICSSAETGSMCAVFAHQAGLRAPPPLVSRRQRRVPPPPAPAARHAVRGAWVPSSSSQNQGATQLF